MQFGPVMALLRRIASEKRKATTITAAAGTRKSEQSGQAIGVLLATSVSID